MDRRLRDSVHRLGGRQSRYLEDRGIDVDDVMELASQSAPGFHAPGPGNGQGIAGPTEVGSHLLHPLEGSIEGPGPTHVEVILAAVRAEIVHVGEEPFRVLVHAVLEGRRAPGTVHRAFRGGAVISGEIDHERVLKAALSLEVLNHPKHLRIRVGHEPCEHLHEPGSHGLIAIVVIRPGGDFIGPGG